MRSVHFALVAVSIAVIVLGSSPSGTEIATARQEIQGIVELRRVWGDKWLEEEAEGQIAAIPAKNMYPVNRFVTEPPDAKAAIASFTGSMHTEKIPIRFDGLNWAVDGNIRDQQFNDTDTTVDHQARSIWLKRPNLTCPPSLVQG
jgi:hypothetical protein